MLHRIAFLSIALMLALLALPLAALPQEARSVSGQTAQEAPSAAPSQAQPTAAEPSAAPDAQEAQETQSQPAESGSQSEPEAQTAASGEDTPAELPAEDASIQVLLPDGSVEAMALEDYLWGVLAAEMPANFEAEALKAQAVAARTYTLYQLAHPKDAHPEADVCTDYTCCQAWISRADRLAKWPEEERENYTQRLSAALEETAGQVLTWEGQPILAVFHASSGGKTRSAQSVWGQALPYLVSVDSPEGENDAPNYYSVVTFSPEEFSALVRERYPQADLSGPAADWVTEAGTDESGAPAAFSVGGVTVTAQQLRSLCALRSATFTVECSEDAVTFYVTGYGHGVGMSQYGANVLAQQGLSWQEILSHYYPGTELCSMDTDS